MTEIRVQPKHERRGSKWPWLLLLLIPIAWFAMRGGRNENERAGEIAPDTAAAVMTDTSAQGTNGATETTGTGTTGTGTTGTGTTGTGTAGGTGRTPR